MNEIECPAFLQSGGSAGKEIVKVAEKFVPCRGPFSERSRATGGVRVVGRIEEDQIVLFTGKIEVSKIAVYRHKTLGKTVRGNVPLQQIEEALMPFDAVYPFHRFPESEQKRNNAVAGAEFEG